MKDIHGNMISQLIIKPHQMKNKQFRTRELRVMPAVKKVLDETNFADIKKIATDYTNL